MQLLPSATVAEVIARIADDHRMVTANVSRFAAKGVSGGFSLPLIFLQTPYFLLIIPASFYMHNPSYFIPAVNLLVECY